ncbi:hypothetical protein CBR_g32194 [Chara braunii]|uniref:Reverse transcriptase domain-containing protein n=1 Tax=Chara braunii TaxID=69332 RepID=A0A388JN17_CHABU|nr:hypothetical protein CBR_g32194 [Chara braunii]|eukprot:GBG59178.1 hypothetical protein CBR_g32194 [Chara braunii]
MRDAPPKKKKYAVRLEEGFDVERVIDRLLEGHNGLMTLKEILASAPRLRDELKGRLSRRLVPNVHLGTILPKEAEWAESGTKMDWKCVACGTVDLVVKGSKCAAMVDTGVEMNIIWEADAIKFGLDIDRSDCGILHGASCKAVFCGTASNVLIEVGKVRVRACFFIMPDVDHGILLGKSFLSRTETVMFNKHDGTLILLLCDPACRNYEIITCRNTGPRSIRNQPNPGSFTIEESEGERRRLRAEPEGEEEVKAFSLSLSDVGKAMDLVAAHEMADPDVIQALREQEASRLCVSDEERGRLDVDKIPMIRIHTVPHEPWNMRGARYPNPDEEKQVVDYLDGKIRTDVADYSSGPYASSWFYFIKPNGTLRWVQDLQRLNAVTVRDVGGLPNADALSESCAGRPIISLIDLYSGYDHFPVYPPDRPVTAIHTPRGLIHMNVAPQGWTNAVAMVQRAMIRAMQSVSPHSTQPYIDDLAVKGPAVKESDEVSPGVRRFVWKHIQDLEKIMSPLEEHNLTASRAKSRHCMREATILGFVCSEKGRKPDVKKRDKITEWSVSFHSITDVRSFLGYPIWQAPSGYERRVELVLKPFEEEDPWGGKGVQWMMELSLGSSHSLVEDMRTIEGGPGQVERHEDLMGGMYLLVNTLLQESLDQSGSLNPAGNVDEVSESQDDEFEEGEIKDAFRAKEYDGIYLELGLLLSCEMRLRDASDRAQRMLQRYLVRDGHLFVRREVGNPRRVICGRNRQIDVVAALHDGIAGEHRGVQATYAKLSELYYWDGMMDMVGKFCRSCIPCQERSRLRQGEPLHARLEREVGAVVHLDLLFMPLGDQGYNYIFDACNNLSGFVDGRVIRTKTGSDFTKTAMPRGGKGTRPPQRPLGASGGYGRHGSRHRQSTPVYDDGDVELFLDSFWEHARRRGWTMAQAIERLRGAGRFEEPIARIRREATTRQEVESRMQELRPSPVGPDGRPIRLEIGNAANFIPAFEWFMQGHGTPRDEWARTLPLWTRKAERPLARQRDPEPREARPSRRGRKALARREEEPGPEPEAEERGAYPECGLGPVEFHRFTEGGLRRSPARTQEETPASEGPLRELEAHLDISQMRASPQGEEHGEQAEEVPQEEVPREGMPRENVQDTQRERGQGDEGRSAGKEVIGVGEDTPPQTPAHPDLEEPTPAEPRQEPCQPEQKVEAEIPKRVDLRTRERAPAGETAEEKRARRTRRIDEIWQERQRLEAAGELPEQQQERRRLETAGTLPAEPRQEPLMGRVILEPEEARAQGQAERKAFEFRAPTELATLPVAAAGPVVPLAVEEGLPPSSSEPAQGSAEGSMGVFLEVVHTMQEEASLFSPKQRIEEPLEREMGIEAEGVLKGRLQRLGTPEYEPEGIEEQPMVVPGEMLERRLQRLDTPEYVPATGDLRSRLGSWAIGSGSGGPVPEIEQQEVVSTAGARSEQQGVVSTMVGSPSSPPPQPRKKKFKRKVGQLCFYCKRRMNQALECREFLEDKAEGKVSKAGGKMYDRQGRIVEKSADGLRAQLYKKKQEELRR